MSTTKRAMIWSATLMLVALTAQAAKGGNGKGKGGGGSGGGDDVTGCVVFSDVVPPSDADEITSDGRGTYCHGSSGQISMTKRMRIDLKKFNPDDRQIVADPICSGGAPCLASPALVPVFQSQKEFSETTGQSTDVDLSFPDIPVGDVRRVSMRITLTKTRALLFGNTSDPSTACTGGVAEPIYVRCDGADAASGDCNDWTVSTWDPRDPTNAAKKVAGCLENSRRGTTIDAEVEGDFTMDLYVP